MSVVSPNPAPVDVIIPTYNNARFLPLAIKSVLDQTRPPERVIVVDDASTDDTEAVVRGLGDRRVEYYRQPENRGPSAARNEGFRHSRAKYIAYLDADDLWYPKKLAKQLALLERHPELGLAYGTQDCINVAGEKTGVLTARKRGRVFDDLLAGNIITGSASMAMVPRAVLEDVGGWPEKIRIGEDWELWLRIAQKYEVDFVPEALAAVRLVPTGAQQNFLKMARDHEMLLGVILDGFKLTRRQRQVVVAACSWFSGANYYKAGEPKQARKVMLRLLMVKPLIVFNYRHWDMLARIFIGEKALHLVFGTKARPTWVRTALQRLKRAAKGRVRHAG